MGEPLLSDGGAGSSLRWRLLAATCYVPSALCFFNYGLGLLCFPLLFANWGIPVASVAYLKTVAEVAETAFSFPASTVAIKHGAVGGLLLGCLGYIAATLCLSMAPGFEAIALCYFLQCGAVKVFNRGRSIIMKDVPKALYGRTNGILILLRCVFTSAAPVVLGLVLDSLGGVQHVFLLQGGLGLLMLASISAGWWASSQAVQAAAGTVSRVPRSSQPTEKVAEHMAYRDLLSGDCRATLVRTAGLCSFIGMLIGAYNILLPVVSLALDIPVAHLALSMGLCYGTAGSFSVLGGKAVDHNGHRTTMVSAMLLLALGHVVLAALALVGTDCATPVLVVAAILLGLGDSLASPLRGALKNDYADSVRRWAHNCGRDERMAIARSFALLDVILDVVGVVYPIGLGLCATCFSATLASCIFAGFGILGALLAYLSTI